ncbi:MAG: CcmD family protein [Bacteroidota bacterium]|jgi:ABC-type amino acid transport system permease subunit
MLPFCLMVWKSWQTLQVSLGTSSGPSETSGVEMADMMRSNGKIYVVLAVVLLIQAGLFVFLWNLDRRLSRWESSTKGKSNS